MRNRCYRVRNKFYARYGGRGIRVCERWRLSFADFLADVGLRPSPRHTLDRINNDGHYEPGNVRWATQDVQAHNSSRAKLNPELVRRLRADYAVAPIHQRTLAKRYGVSQGVIQRVLAGHSWKHV